MNSKRVGSVVKNITESTPVSIALVLALCGGAYWTGGAVTELRVRQTHTEAVIDDHSELMQKLTEIAADNKRRLEFLERAK